MSKYKTKQREIIEEYLKEHHDQCLRVQDIYNHLINKQEVGMTTIYRALENLIDEGKVRKYVNDDTATFQWMEEACSSVHYHLKCLGCGLLIHLECDEMKNLEKHIFRDHQFQLDQTKTTLYGLCPKCKKEQV